MDHQGMMEMFDLRFSRPSPYSAPSRQLGEMCTARAGPRGTYSVGLAAGSSFSASQRIVSSWASLRSRGPRSTTYSESKLTSMLVLERGAYFVARTSASRANWFVTITFGFPACSVLVAIWCLASHYHVPPPAVVAGTAGVVTTFHFEREC